MLRAQRNGAFWMGLFLAGLFLEQTTVPASSVPLGDVVPDYMEGDLETAIIPTPKKAELKERCHEVAGSVLCVAPEILVKARRRLQASGILAMPAGRKRDGALRKLGKELAQKGWPDPAGMVMQVDALFQKIKFVTRAPLKAAGTILLLSVKNPASGKQGSDLARPKVHDPETAEEAYVLSSGTNGTGKAGARIAVRGAGPWGLLWGAQTLRQMIFRKDGKRYVREGKVQDWPTFWFRGGKRGKSWWVKYKGNASFGGREWGFAKQRLWPLHFWNVKGDGKSVAAIKRSFGKAVESGASAFMLDYNDGAFSTKKNASEPFPGDPGRTVKYLYKILAKERAARQAGIKLGYMPSAYSLAHGPRAEGSALKKANALEDVDFIFHNGLAVWTFHYPEKAAQAYRDVFGFQGKMIYYDCQCLRKPLGVLDLEDRKVWKYLSGVSLQNASFIFAISALDYAWNPEAYDPVRALKLGCREWAGGDPETYRALYDFLSYFNKNDFIAQYVPRKKLLAMEKKITEGMIARFEKLKPLLEKRGLGEVAKFIAAADINSEVGHRPFRRQAFLALMEQHGFKEYRVKRAAGPISIDGKLDEDAWKNAPAMPSFVRPGYRIKFSGNAPLDESLARLSEGCSVTAKALYDAEAIYFSYVIKGLSKNALAAVRKALEKKAAKPALTPHCWRHGPTVELYVNEHFDRTEYRQLLCTAPNEYTGFLHQHFDPEKPYAGWDPRADFRFTLSEPDTLIFEGKMPYREGLHAPKPGAVWSVQLQCNKMFEKDSVVRWCLSYETWASAPKHRYGRWIFE